MNIIDARSGRQHLKVGDTVEYPGGEGFEILALDVGIFSGTIRARMLDTGEEHSTSLTVRFLHPDFPFQRVAFIET